jgi:transcription elongation GreA/GreB family factor
MASKKEIFAALTGRAQDMANRAREGRDEAQREANSHVGAMESRYDTFKEEAQYLAGAQQKRLQEITAAAIKIGEVANNDRLMRGDFARVSIGCIVTVFDEQFDAEKKMIVSPALGGEKIQLDDDEFVVVTPESPIGQVMIGKTVDDDFSLVITGKRQSYSILSII